MGVAGPEGDGQAEASRDEGEHFDGECFDALFAQVIDAVILCVTDPFHPLTCLSITKERSDCGLGSFELCLQASNLGLQGLVFLLVAACRSTCSVSFLLQRCCHRPHSLQSNNKSS